MMERVNVSRNKFGKLLEILILIYCSVDVMLYCCIVVLNWSIAVL